MILISFSVIISIAFLMLINEIGFLDNSYIFFVFSLNKVYVPASPNSLIEAKPIFLSLNEL